MAWRRVQAALALVIMVTATPLASAQPAAAAAFPALPSCPPAPLSLSPCIGFVFGVGTATLSSCCAQLRSFLKAQAPCLCAASKLAPSPVGLILGQAQTMIPNVCDLPNPCDDADAAAGDGEGSAPVAGDSAPATEPSSSTAAADPDAAKAPPTEDSPDAAAAAPDGAGSMKLPELLHAAGATSSRGMAAAGTVFAAAFLASVASMYL